MILSLNALNIQYILQLQHSVKNPENDADFGNAFWGSYNVWTVNHGWSPLVFYFFSYIHNDKTQENSDNSEKNILVIFKWCILVF